MKILVVSAYYAPERAGNAPYVSGVAEHYAAQGHDVVVLSGMPHYPSWQLELAPKRSTLRGVTVVRRPHYVPAGQSARHRARYELSLAACGARSLVGLARPDVIVGVVPTLSGAVLARAASAYFRRPFGLVFQDLMGRAAVQSGVSGGIRFAQMVSNVERAAARRASVVGIVADGFRGYFDDAGIPSDRLVRLRNWANWSTPTLSSEAVRRENGWDDGRFLVVHAGNMGHKQGLENVLAAARLLTGHPIRIILAGDGNMRSRLQQLSRDWGLPNVEFVDPLDSGRFEALLLAADVLLLNQRGAVGDMSLPSKLTSYFAAARPIVAAVAPRSEAAREIERARGGIVVAPDDPRALADAVAFLRRSPQQATRLAEQARAYADSGLERGHALGDYERFLQQIAAAGSARYAAAFVPDL